MISLLTINVRGYQISIAYCLFSLSLILIMTVVSFDLEFIITTPCTLCVEENVL